MKKLLILFLFLFFLSNNVMADTITKLLDNLNINKESVSIDLKDVNDNDIYSLNSKVPRMPASTLKLVTMAASLDTLGKDYLYSTILYKSVNNDLYLKLSGDPSLTSMDLKQLIKSAKDKGILPRTFYIDDTCFDSVEWGEGWQWDDALNPLMPKFSSYNIDSNLIKLQVIPTKNNLPPKIVLDPEYPISIVNNAITDFTKDNNNIAIEKTDSNVPNLYNLAGFVSSYYQIMLPANNTKLFFRLALENAIKARKFQYYDVFKIAKVPKDKIYVVDKVQHSVSDMLPLVIKTSNNLYAESIFKTAGAVWAGSIGSNNNSLGMLKSYFSKIGLNDKNIKIVDGSGVSKNNLITADFMTSFLIKEYNQSDFEYFKSLLPKPGEGTLSKRMLYFKDNLLAKTGTLTDTSAIAGYITTRRAKTYAFDIMIMDSSTKPSDKKNLEEQILRIIYERY